jgi:hypothetical protein
MTMTSDVQISGFTGAPQSINVASPLPRLLQKRSSLERQLRQVNRDIEWLERKQSLAEFVAADRINSGRTDIPALAEVVEWDVRFRAEYRRLHEDRNAAALASTTNSNEGQEMVDEDPIQLLAKDKELTDLDAAATAFAEHASVHRGAGFEAAADLVGIREPRLSLLTCPLDEEAAMGWWAGAYQRIGLL